MTRTAETALAAASEWLTRAPYVFRDRFRLRHANIGARLTACFVAIVLSMMAAAGIVTWQFSRIAAPDRRLAQADQTSLSVLRLQLDLDIFRENLSALASTHDNRQFTTEAAELKKKFVEDVTRSEELLGSSADWGQDPTILSALETLRTMLPSQLDSAVELASAKDWTAVRLRLQDQVKNLVEMSSLLVQKVDREVSQARAEALENVRRARRQLVVVLPATALLTLLVVVSLGWHATRSITDPLSELERGARALAQGDFQHRVAMRGEDELARLGHVFNDTAHRLAALYETLRSSEARLRLTIDTIPAYVWSALPDGSLDFINKRWLEFSGLSLEQGLGWGWEVAVHPEDRHHFVEIWREAIASGTPMEAEARVRRADGQYRWLLIRNVPLHDQAGNIVKWYGKSSDIDDRKRAEQALKQSQAYLTEAQILSHTGSWAYDPAIGEISYWSEELFRIHGLKVQSSNAPDRDQVSRLVHPEDRARVQEVLRCAIRDKTELNQEYRIVRPDAALRHIHVIGHPVLDEAGQLLEYIGTAIDVTEHKQAEEELRAAETRFRTFVDHATDALIVHDEQGKIVDINRRASESLGYSREELIGMRPTDFDCGRDRPTMEAMAKRLEAGETIAFETLHRRKDGLIFPVEVSVGSFPLGGRRFALALARDITDRKRAEKALRRSEFYLTEAQKLSHTGSWALDPVAKQYVYWSAEMYRMWGLAPQNGLPLFETVADRIHPEDRDRVLESLSLTLRERKDSADEYRIVLPDGTVRHIDTRRHPVLNPTGELLEYVGTTMDVSEQYLNRAALEQAFEEIKALKDQLYKENLALREEVVRASMFEEIVGASKSLEAVLAQVGKVAPTDSTVLITGETGTGKELIARAIHKSSQRSARAFISVNCATFAPSLISSELFGHEKGAFTGATQRHIGRFELADGGTIFLDEVGELPLDTQLALLRVLQEREFERVGGTQTIKVDVRLVAATNRDLSTAIANGAFRQDLFYRVNVFPIEVPPLRQRTDDILMLVEYFVQRYATRAGKNIRSINKKTLELFQSYKWPGNVRELQNVIERSVILTTGDTLRVDASWLSQESDERLSPIEALHPVPAPRQREERDMIEAALAESRGRVSGPAGAAAKLRVPRSTLESRIRALKINKSQFKFRSGGSR